MRLYPKDSLWNRAKPWLSGGFILLAAGFFVAVFFGLDGSVSREQLKMEEETIRKAAINCYASEGSYPQNVDYLIEHYGVQIDLSKYAVIYSTLGSNSMPYIEVVPKGGRTRLDDSMEW